MDITLFAEFKSNSAKATYVLRLPSPTIIPNLIVLCIRKPQAIPETPEGAAPTKKS